MTDPRRFTDDPGLSDPVLHPDDRIGGIDPVIHRDENVGGMWSWVAGVALLLLIGFLIFGSNRTASKDSSTYTASTPARTATPPSTTGYGSSSPQPDHPGATEERLRQ